MPGEPYIVSATISRNEETRVMCLAENLLMHENGSVSWEPQ